MRIERVAIVVAALWMSAAACAGSSSGAATTTAATSSSTTTADATTTTVGTTAGSAASTTDGTLGSDGSTPQTDGGAATTSTPSTTPAVATTQAPPSTTIALPTNVTAIVSLSPTATEMLYAIGADDQVKATDSLSNYPKAAREKMTEIEAYTPSIEAVVALEPDLVITDGTNPEFIGQLDAANIAHWEGPVAESLDDVYAQITQLGTITGHTEEAAGLTAQMKTDIDASIASVPPRPVSFYHELDNTYYSATSGTFIGKVYGLFGMVNIADAAPGGAEALFPQLSSEYIISANPEIIYMACGDSCNDTPEMVDDRPGWGEIPAVKNGNIVELDPDVVSRWGPRVVEFVQAVATSLTEVGN